MRIILSIAFLIIVNTLSASEGSSNQQRRVLSYDESKEAICSLRREVQNGNVIAALAGRDFYLSIQKAKYRIPLDSKSGQMLYRKNLLVAGKKGGKVDKATRKVFKKKEKDINRSIAYFNSAATLIAAKALKSIKEPSLGIVL